MAGRSRSVDRAHAALMASVAATVAAYWLDYFTAGHVRLSEDPCYVQFENAFPAADGLMATAFAASAWHLLRGRSSAVPVGVAAGGGMTFLGAMDTLWNLQHGNYRRLSPQMGVETYLNVFCLLFGPWTVVRLWRRRTALT
jgi:hypothetical protein